MPSLLDGPDAEASNGWFWRESQIDVALVKKIERTGRASGVCKAKSTPGFSVGGAWLLVLDFGDGLRCSYRRCARLEVERSLKPLMDAIRKAMSEASTVRGLHEGNRTAKWDLGARDQAP